MTSPTRRLVLKTVIGTIVALAALGALAGWLVLKSGWYDIASTRQHLQPVHTLLEQGMHESVRHHARAVQVPAAVLSAITATTMDAMAAATSADGQRLRQGAALYRDHCVLCHGAPGVAQAAIGKSMQPVPGPLADAARRWQPRELYWITRHGIKMSGMPAWEFHLADEDIWRVVGFVVKLAELSPQEYAGLTAPENRWPAAAPAQRTLADPKRGQVALAQYACHACHMIPGVTGSDVFVGPPLKDIAGRKYIAGRLPNNADNLVRWIRDPRQIDPLTAMPKLDVSEADARDMAAYLFTLR